MTQSNKWGTALMTLGVLIFSLYVVDYVDLIRPGERPEEWGLIIMGGVVTSIGFMLRTGEGEKVSEAFLSWFKKRGGDGS